MVDHFTHLQILALFIAAVCGYIDYKTTKIPNVITFPSTLLGWILNFIAHGWEGLGWAVLGAVIGVALTVIPKRKQDDAIAFGDAKLMMAMGAILGTRGILLAFFCFSLCWGLIAVWRFFSVFPFKNLIGAFFAKNAGGNMFDAETAAKVQKVMKEKIPIAPAIAAGVFLSELFGPAILEFMGFTP